MADEQATADTTVEPKAETKPEVIDSEVENKTTAENTTEGVEDKGDLRVPLKEERTKRQELEAQINNPEFISQKAKELGLVEEQEFAPQTETPNVSAAVQYELSKEKALEKYPSLRVDEDLQVMVTGFINKGIDPLKAADKAFDKIKKQAEESAKQQAEEDKKEVNAQNRAKTIDTTNVIDDDGYAQLLKDSKSYDKRTSDAANIELIKLRMKRTESK